jgi:hypothetical protein
MTVRDGPESAPKGMERARLALPAAVIYCRDAIDAATGADALVLNDGVERISRAFAHPIG